jgi:hypothetical protein
MCSPFVSKMTLPVSFAGLVVALIAAAGVTGTTAAARRACATPLYQNGLDVVFGRASSKTAADGVVRRAQRVGFRDVKAVQESCRVWKAVLRGLDSFDTAVGVQAEARRVHLLPTVECAKADETGQLQAIFGTRRTVGELAQVIQTAGSFGYVGLKTKRAPCGGYQAYVAGFTSVGQADSFAETARERTGLRVGIIKA